MQKIKKMTRLTCILLLGLCNLGRIDAGETPETILIRQTLSNDLYGHRRGDAELVLTAYDQNFAAYAAHGSADPRAWSIVHESREAFASVLASDLAANRYETERTIPSIQVRASVATATTVDSGQVIDRQSGAARRIRTRRFWTLLKREDRWRVTAVVENLGDSTATITASEHTGEITAVLEREKEAREAGDSAAITALFAEHFSGYNGKNVLTPATWQLIFNGSEELEKHLNRRLPYVHYRLDRHMLHTHVRGQEALAITREKISATHERGEVQHKDERYVLWTLSRRSGSWKITNMLYNLGLDE
jgi:ketosteroid isomerase-like protein